MLSGWDEHGSTSESDGYDDADVDTMTRTERLQALTEALRRAGAQGRTAESLAVEFEVAPRTVKRDLAALDAAGLPVWGRTGPGGGYGLSERASLPPVNLSPGQALALGAAVAASQGAPFADAARTAMGKVLDVLDPLARQRATTLAARVWVDAPPAAPRRTMSVLEKALVDQRCVRITFTDLRGATTRREVEPMIFALRRGQWYLIAWCRLREGIRWFEVSRIASPAGTRRPCAGHDVSEIGEPPASARAVVM